MTARGLNRRLPSLARGYTRTGAELQRKTWCWGLKPDFRPGEAIEL
jgi:hypothetical protein